jgi:prepilin-type N-terminal cleavage/methylation domain-containing protein
MDKNRGFTLIELIITIAVLGIMTTMAAPSFTKIVAQKS